MNAFAPLPRATDAPALHRFTADDLREIYATGVLGDGRVELIDGEIIDMPSDGPLHQNWAVELTHWLVTRGGAGLAVLPASTLRINDRNVPSPDFVIYPRGMDAAVVDGRSTLLVIEESDTSLHRDLKLKADLYASGGVRDYWVIDLKAEEVHVHREPGAEGYRSVQVFGRDEAVTALLAPDLVLRLADIPRPGA